MVTKRFSKSIAASQLRAKALMLSNYEKLDRQSGYIQFVPKAHRDDAKVLEAIRRAVEWGRFIAMTDAANWIESNHIGVRDDA